MSTRRPAPSAIARSAAQWGEHVATWRRLQRLTSQQLAERAGVSRDTISRLENGDPSVGFEVVLRVARALGLLQALERAIDPFESDLGRLRIDERLPKRVRS